MTYHQKLDRLAKDFLALVDNDTEGFSLDEALDEFGGGWSQGQVAAAKAILRLFEECDD